MNTVTRTHDQHTTQQFGPQAQAYLTSAVHSQGADLADMAARLRGRHEAQVLDLGCGAGHLSFAIASEVGRVTAFDLSDEMLRVTAGAAAERGLRNIETCRGSVDALPFTGASFDVVCTRFSAHHWPDLRRGLREARRVLKPGGSLHVIDIVAPDSALLDTHLQTVEVLRDPSHVRDYSLADWQGALQACGFALRSHRSWKLRMEFDVWIARMRTPADRAAVIRSLMAEASAEVREGFALGPDGSFDIDAAFIEAVPV